MVPLAVGAVTSHVWRPVAVVVAFVAALLAARSVFVPADFGVHEQGYRFGWYRKGNEDEWKSVTVKYQRLDLCAGCHVAQAAKLARSPHAPIGCQNCHGPALEHPSSPPKLTIDKSRGLCLRCHAKLQDVGTARAAIKGIRDTEHYADTPCSQCHNPHGQPVQ